MNRVAAASVAVVIVAIFSVRSVSGGWQEDPFSALYYVDNGVVPCRDYGTANGARFATYRWWLLGFVSGAGHVRSAMTLPIAKTDAAAAVEWATNYCASHPQEPLASAGVTLVAMLASRP